MSIDDIITLDNNREYVLLDEKELDGKKYFYALGIDKKEDSTNEYVIIEEINKDGKSFIKKVTDKSMLDLLVTMFTINYMEMVDEEVGE